jgi:hypothetical protein
MNFDFDCIYPPELDSGIEDCDAVLNMDIPYQKLEKIGAGSFSTVYKGYIDLGDTD